MEHWKLNLYIIWFSQILSLMSFSFGMPFLPYYIQELGVTDPVKVKLYSGILGAAAGLAGGLSSPLWGIAADRWGKKLMLLRAMLCASLVIGGCAIATRVEHLIILRSAQGLFTGTVAAASILVASSTPGHRLSYALGFLSSATFIGNSIGPAIGGFLAEYIGYRKSFLAGGLLMLFDFFLVLFAVKENKLMQHEETENKSGSSSVPLMIPSVILLLLAVLFMTVSRSAFGPYLPLYVQEILNRIDGAARVTGIINGVVGLMTAMSGILLSRLGDRYDKTSLLKILLLTGIALTVPVFFAGSLWFFTISLGLLFFSIGGIEPVITSIAAENTPRERRGAIFGLLGLVNSLGWAVSPMLAGIISIRYSLHSILLLIPAFLFAALLMILIYRKKNVSTA